MSSGCWAFEPGRAYMVTPVFPGARKVVLACTGRRGTCVTFARVEGIYRVRAVEIDGRETAMIKGRDGLDYFASAVVEVDVARAVDIVEAMGERA